MSYDQQCYDLAENFLSDTLKWKELPVEDKNVLNNRLAQDIQKAIEDFIAEYKLEE